ncbi:ABC transporter substrate-binding protein [Rhodococcus sp. D2-41]|uniref:ABC transporter substrate-binding protein n=1 Tax=Speluncibacter jeojiensis TaxID=2710754 RepID=A0A9X4M1Z3_9ACTN|nr:ABC transporter substrate-binding protein [Rhodococcus sp. D2-41]MDG3012524.1 ABC transporter substrate-binding protein [Rhodococcus sp. D2-41]MDG3015359.1 ABC transporter substrate-binding protein [Corynebacteriales bacterium D3-21]
MSGGVGRARGWLRAVSAIGVVAAVLALSACGSNETSLTGRSGSGEVVVGSGSSPLGEVVAEIYAGALRDAGAKVRTDLGLGAREQYLAALDGGKVNLVPELTGQLLDHYDRGATATEGKAVYEALSRSLPEQLSVSDPAAAEDREALVVTETTAHRFDLKSITDLAPHCAQLTLGGPFAVSGSRAGLVGLREVYGCGFEQFAGFPLDTATPDPASADRQLADALRTDRVQVAALSTATPEVTADSFVVLQDDKSLFPAQNVIPLFRKGALTADQIKVLDRVAGELTTGDLADMIGRVQAGQKPAAVAAEWLPAHGL